MKPDTLLFSAASFSAECLHPLDLDPTRSDSEQQRLKTKEAREITPFCSSLAICVLGRLHVLATHSPRQCRKSHFGLRNPGREPSRPTVSTATTKKKKEKGVTHQEFASWSWGHRHPFLCVSWPRSFLPKAPSYRLSAVQSIKSQGAQGYQSSGYRTGGLYYLGKFVPVRLRSVLGARQNYRGWIRGGLNLHDLPPLHESTRSSESYTTYRLVRARISNT